MSRHEGVSCDSCLKGNFRGRRYKCLICYDYDLCAACYEAGATTTRHTTEHPMQCILTRADFELYYGGEALTTVETPQAYTCPYCNRMGFTDSTLQEHVTTEHSDISFEVVCPVCASLPGGDPNLMTDDFAGHLTLEHRSGPRDLISFLDEPVGTRHNVRRIPHSARGIAGTRSRRSNMHFSSSGGLSSLSPSSRENVDPIAELLSQLSGVRRSTTNTSVARQQLERLPRRQLTTTTVTGGSTQTQAAVVREPSTQSVTSGTVSNGLLLNNVQAVQSSPSRTSQFLLAGSRIPPPDTEVRVRFENLDNWHHYRSRSPSPEHETRVRFDDVFIIDESSADEEDDWPLPVEKVDGNQTCTMTGEPRNIAPHFLLEELSVEPEMEEQRAERSMFVQQLLLSSLGTHGPEKEKFRKSLPSRGNFRPLRLRTGVLSKTEPEENCSQTEKTKPSS